MLEIAATCLVVTALLAYVNHRFIGLPTAIGVMATALVLSLPLVLLDAFGIAQPLRRHEESLLRSIDFSEVLMQGMLSILLFAGALHGSRCFSRWPPSWAATRSPTGCMCRGRWRWWWPAS